LTLGRKYPQSNHNWSYL